MTSVELMDQIDAAIAAHGAWKKRLIDVIELQKIDIDVDTIASDNVCVLGQWLYSGEIPKTEKESRFFNEVQTWHATFHKEADKIMKLILRNEVTAAMKALKEGDSNFNQVSMLLISTLKDWKAAQSMPSQPKKPSK